VKRGYPGPMKALTAALVAVAALAACGGAGARSSVALCSAAQLKATFTVVRGSAGAGNIVYKLSVTNVSSRECGLTGTPAVKLYSKTGKPLPTHVKPVFRPGLMAILVRLQPGMSAHATARFSPDVPGPGEPVLARQCERTSYRVRLTPGGGGSTIGPISPPTPVCEHGTMSFSVFVVGKRGPSPG
jgi:hypothetical protein